jgi:hypothetical protein
MELYLGSRYGKMETLAQQHANPSEHAWIMELYAMRTCKKYLCIAAYARARRLTGALLNASESPLTFPLYEAQLKTLMVQRLEDQGSQGRMWKP